MADALETLGTIIGPDAKRDAVHVAVIPAVAMETLKPGDHVSLVDGGADTGGDRLGIVDPFLTDVVNKGERFWVFIYPRQITSLRHVWTHPDIPEEFSPYIKATKEESEAWLRSWVKGQDLPAYDTVIHAAEDHNGKWGDSIIIHGTSCWAEIPPEFWFHLENLKDRKFEHAQYFSCSC